MKDKESRLAGRAGAQLMNVTVDAHLVLLKSSTRPAFEPASLT